jgi:hypothetical protein
LFINVPGALTDHRFWLLSEDTVFRHLHCLVSALVISAVPAPADAASKVKAIGTVVIYAGTCEPSAAVFASSTDFNSPIVVASDEDNILRIYDVNAGGEPSRTVDLNGFLDLDPDDEDEKADLEAATRLNGRIFWLASHSRSAGKGKVRPSRHQFFTTEVSADAAEVTVRPVEMAQGGIMKAVEGITEPDLRKSIRADRDEDEDLRPERHGLNIEGMAAGFDGTSVLIGLRNPLSADGYAIVLSLKNPVEVVKSGNDPDFDAPMLLDLGRRGIRSLEYSLADTAYYIAAGPVGDAPGNQRGFGLYRWSGKKGDAPTPVDGFGDAIAEIKDFHPEAMIIAPDGRRIRLLSDDGDVCNDDNPAFRAIDLAVE